MNLDELPALVKRLEDRASEAAAMQATQHEIGAALQIGDRFELARMLSGMPESDSGRTHAAELLQKAHAEFA